MKNLLVDNLIHEKLAYLGHDCNAVNISVKNNYSIEELFSKYRFFSEWNGTDVSVQYDGFRNYSDEKIERIIEHEMTHLALIKEGRIINYKIMHRNPWINSHVQYLYEGFKDYVSTKRQSDIFGYLNLKKFILEDDNKIFNNLRQQYSNDDDINIILPYILKLIPEKFKHDSIGDIEKFGIINDLLSPMEQIFNYIKEKDVNAYDSFEILKAPFSQFAITVNLPISVLNNKTTLFEEYNNIMDFIPQSEYSSVQNLLCSYINESFGVKK